MDRIQASGIWARVTASWAAAAGRQLLWGVGDAVTGAGARVTLEGVEEAHPVADLVGYGLAEVVVGLGAARRSAVENGAAVQLFLLLVPLLF